MNTRRKGGLGLLQKKFEMGSLGLGTCKDGLFDNAIEVIRSDRILTNVVVMLNLPDSWADGINECVKVIHQRMKLTPAENDWCIEVCFSSQNPIEAAKLVNGVRATYLAWQREAEREKAEALIYTLEKQLALHDQKIHDAESQLKRLNEALQIPSPEPSAVELKTHDPEFSKAARELDELRNFRLLLARKLNIEKTDLSIPKSPLVEITDVAVPPTKPMRRPWIRGALLILTGLVCLGWGASLLRNMRFSNSKTSF